MYCPDTQTHNGRIALRGPLKWSRNKVKEVPVISAPACRMFSKLKLF